MTRKWWTLAAVSIATFMLLLDITVVNTALPSIRKDLGGNFADLQWVIDAYTLALAAVVLMAGTIADRVGRRRTFVLGLGIFSLASGAIALSPSTEFLIAGRAVQGIGGAIMFALSLARLRPSYRAATKAWIALRPAEEPARAAGSLVHAAVPDSARGDVARPRREGDRVSRRRPGGGPHGRPLRAAHRPPRRGALPRRDRQPLPDPVGARRTAARQQ